MMFNKITNELEIIGSSISELEIRNDISEFQNDMSKSFGMDVTEVNVEGEGRDRLGLVTIRVIINISSENQGNCSLTMDIEGAFKTSDETSHERFMELLYINGVSALLGIARGKLEAISAMIFNSGKISIPFVNVLDYYSDVVKNQNKK